MLIVLVSQVDSEDEREAQASKVALGHKLRAQALKKSKKNYSHLPRTAGLRTLTELTTELSKAGLDPSKIQERAEQLSKMRAAKRKRDSEADESMDVDDDNAWVDVDGAAQPKKRVKGIAGAVIAANGRAPQKDRQLAGLRDEAVRFFEFASCATI